jgi:hypothetical protein
VDAICGEVPNTEASRGLLNAPAWKGGGSVDPSAGRFGGPVDPWARQMDG